MDGYRKKPLIELYVMGIFIKYFQSNCVLMAMGEMVSENEFRYKCFHSLTLSRSRLKIRAYGNITTHGLACNFTIIRKLDLFGIIKFIHEDVFQSVAAL